MPLTYIVTEKYHKISEAYQLDNEAKIQVDPYMDATETILPICKCLQSTPVTNIGTEK